MNDPSYYAFVMPVLPLSGDRRFPAPTPAPPAAPVAAPAPVPTDGSASRLYAPPHSPPAGRTGGAVVS